MSMKHRDCGCIRIAAQWNAKMVAWSAGASLKSHVVALRQPVLYGRRQRRLTLVRSISKHMFASSPGAAQIARCHRNNKSNRLRVLPLTSES